MSQSNTLFIGMDVHKDAIAVAYVAQDHGAAVMYLGAIGTRQCAIDQRIRKRQSKATHLLFIYEAGPCGDWLYRYRTKTGDDCWVVAPSLIPKKPGDRVKTDRRDAVQLARLARSGDLTAVYVPRGKMTPCAISPVHVKMPSAISTEAKRRLTAFWLRHNIRSVSRAHWGPAPVRWLSAVVCPTPVQHMVFQESVRAVANIVTASNGSNRNGPSTSKPGVCSGGRGPPGAAGGAVHRRGPPRGRNGGPDTGREPTGIDAVYGPDAFGAFLR